MARIRSGKEPSAETPRVPEEEDGHADASGQPSPLSALSAATPGLPAPIGDVAATVFDVTPIDYFKFEGTTGSTTYQFSVTRTGDVSATGSVQWAVTGNGATPVDAADFVGGVLPSGILNFAAGQSSQTITLDLSTDATVELDDGFIVTLSNPSAGAILGAASATGVITNDDSVVLDLSTADWYKAEGTGGTTDFLYTVTRTGDPSAAASVQWTVTGSGASPATAVDFIGGALPSGTLSFLAGEVSKTISIAVSPDSTIEPDDGFTIALSGASAGLTLGNASLSSTIGNDDFATSSSTPHFDITPIDYFKYEGTGGSTSYQFSVTRTGDSTAAASVRWAVTGSGASPANAADFVGGVLPSGTVNFAAGQTSQTITLNFSTDTSLESDEGFTVTLSNPSAGTDLGTASAAGTISNDDTVSLTMSTTDWYKLEGTGATTTYQYTVTRSGDPTIAGTVQWAVTGGSTNPANAADFVGGVLPSGTLSFASGELTKTITVNVVGDSSQELDENFTVALSNPSAGLTLGSSAITSLLANDDTVVLDIATTDWYKAEGTGGTTDFLYTVTRTGDPSVAGTVQWAVTGSGTSPATAVDFIGGVLPSGTLSFLAGEVSKTISIAVSPDSTIEPDDGFTIALSGASAGLTLGITSLSSAIGNDDYATTPGTPGTTSSFAIAATSAELPEGNSGMTAFTFTVTRTGTTDDTASVKWVVTGSGTNPVSLSDFPNSRLPSGSLVFASGETSQVITVYARGDTTAEQNEQFSVVLSTPSAGAGIGTASATGVVLNDDSSMYAITASTPAQSEGNSGGTAFTFVVTRTGKVSASGKVNWAVSGTGGTPANATDFVGGRLPSGSISFAAGVTSQTITVYVAGDTAVEANENFTVTLSRPASSGFITVPSVSATITNDDAAAALPLAVGLGQASGVASGAEATFAFDYTHLGHGPVPSGIAFMTYSGAPADNPESAWPRERAEAAQPELCAEDFAPHCFPLWPTLSHPAELAAFTPPHSNAGMSGAAHTLLHDLLARTGAGDFHPPRE